MRNKKGFTLVELVIVIAVIAILAGVMIGTFASVVKKAKKSAEQQEMAAAKQEQVANDVIEKLNNGSWLGWTDFEEKLAKALSDVNVTVDGAKTEATVKAAVTAALNEYAAAHPSTGTTNTGLTEQQVKYIIENALSGQLTAEQVKAIVNNAVSSTSTLTKSQVQAIVDAAVGKTITPSQVKEAVDAVIKANKVSSLTVEEVEDTINSILDSRKYSTLTEKEIEKIVKELLKDYSVEAKSVSTVADLEAAFAKNDKVTNVVVKLTDDMDLTGKTETLKIENNTVLDLGGKTITTSVKDAITVSAGATVTIKGAGKIESKDNGEQNRIIVNEGNLVIEDGTFVAGSSNEAANSCAAIQNKNIMTINGGDFAVNDGALYLIYSFDTATTVINGGTFNSPTPVATNGRDSLYTNLIINGGTFNGTSETSPVVFIPAGTVSIYGGTFNAKVTAATICGGNVSIYGGKFVTTAKAIEAKKTCDFKVGDNEYYKSKEEFTFSSADVTNIDWSPNDGSRITDSTFLVCVNRTGYNHAYVEGGVYNLFIGEGVEFDTVASKKVQVCTPNAGSTVIVTAASDSTVTKNIEVNIGSTVVDAKDYSKYNVTINVK